MTLEQISKTVCDHFGIDHEHMIMKTGERRLLIPRHISMYFASKKTNKSFKEIGEFFGGFDHATAMSAEKNIKNLISTDRYFAEEIAKIEMKLNDLVEEPTTLHRLQSVIDRLDTGEITINQIKKELAEIAILMKKR